MVSHGAGSGNGYTPSYGTNFDASFNIATAYINNGIETSDCYYYQDEMKAAIKGGGGGATDEDPGSTDKNKKDPPSEEKQGQGNDTKGGNNGSSSNQGMLKYLNFSLGATIDNALMEFNENFNPVYGVFNGVQGFFTKEDFYRGTSMGWQESLATDLNIKPYGNNYLYPAIRRRY